MNPRAPKKPKADPWEGQISLGNFSGGPPEDDNEFFVVPGGLRERLGSLPGRLLEPTWRPRGPQRPPRAILAPFWEPKRSPEASFLSLLLPKRWPRKAWLTKVVGGVGEAMINKYSSCIRTWKYEQRKQRPLPHHHQNCSFHCHCHGDLLRRVPSYS